MPRRLLIANAALVAIALGAVAYIVSEVTRPPKPAPLRPRPVATAMNAPAPPSITPAAPPPSAYGVIVSRNLFSPMRSEGTAPGQARAALNLPKPTLYGVVIREGLAIAYLEDPSTHRVAGYRLGDAVAGGTVKDIAADHVVLTRPDGAVDVRLRDPSKPRPAQPQAGGAAPGQPFVNVPPAGAGFVTPTPIAPPQPTIVIPPSTPTEISPSVQSPIPPRRLLPPNVLRRVPPTPSDAQR
jgi:hypothetical protein